VQSWRGIFDAVGVLLIGIGGLWLFVVLADGLVEFLKAPIGIKERTGDFDWTPVILIAVGLFIWEIAQKKDRARE